jgi:hypothetical protein
LILSCSGDSYSTTNSWAGGTAPSASNPIGNPSFPGQTTSGGLNWVGQTIARQNSSLVFAYDLAVTGATTDKDIVDTYAQYNFDDQVETLFATYLAGGNGSPPTWGSDVGKVLAAVWFGINDVGEPFWDGISAPINTILDRYFGLLGQLYVSGLRNYVLFTIPRKSLPCLSYPPIVLPLYFLFPSFTLTMNHQHSTAHPQL